MPDPDVLNAMPAAAARIADAMQRGERVAIFGDYDVDGATASALLARFLRFHVGFELRSQRVLEALLAPDARRVSA
jgi:single-stranded-DNA-specific exonuclease